MMERPLIQKDKAIEHSADAVRGSSVATKKNIEVGPRSLTEADEAVISMLQLREEEYPEQFIDENDHLRIGKQVSEGNEKAKEEYISRSFSKCMKIAMQKTSRQTNAVNLSLEDHFQDAVSQVKGFLDAYDPVLGPNFQAYMAKNFTSLKKATISEISALPLSGLGSTYNNRGTRDAHVVQEGVIDIESLKDEKGSGSSEIIDEVSGNLAKKQISEVLGRVSEERRETIKHRYGLEGRNPSTLNETAEQQGVSRETIREREKAGILLLGRIMRTDGLSDLAEDTPDGDSLSQHTSPPRLDMAVELTKKQIAEIDKKGPKHSSRMASSKQRLQTFVDRRSTTRELEENRRYRRRKPGWQNTIS